MRNLVLLVVLIFGSTAYLAQKYLIASEHVAPAEKEKSPPKIDKGHTERWWQPTSGLTFHIQHIKNREEAKNLPDVDVVNLELSHVQTYLGPGFFKATTKKLVCYFSASYEHWRLDAGLYPKDALGDRMREWDESWGNIYKPSLRNFLENRMDLAQSLGCDAIEIDNTDPAFNTEEAGFQITPEQNKEALIDLAKRAHKRKMAIFLKNTGDLAKDLEPHFDGVFNEQCGQYNECRDYEAFVKAQKPVFQVEYHTCKPFPGHIVHKKDDYFSKAYHVCR